jgi:MFS family permease
MSTVEAQARYPLTRGVNPWLVTVSVMLPTFMEVLDTAIASVALPYIAGSLSSTNSEATWVLTSYLVANAVILPASNWFARRFGRKRFLLTCVIIFTVASFFCGAARSLAVILLARVLPGAGGGALQPLSQSILLESFPPAKRSMAMAAYGLGIVVAPNQEMGNATGLFNMLRNIGGSIGIAMATTAIIWRAALHQTEIGANLSPSNFVFQQKSAAMAAYLSHHSAVRRPGPDRWDWFTASWNSNRL